MKMMKYVRMLIMVLGLVVFGCNTDSELSVQNYSAESFPDLTVNMLANIETPFESAFGNSGGRTSQNGVSKEELIERLSQVFTDAAIIEIERETERGLKVWTAKIKMENGGIIKIKVVEELGKIVKMKGKSGPYDYDFNPQGNFISFSAAKELALSTVDGEIKSWSLELEEENQWEYEFHIKTSNRRVEVEIKGFGEEVISVKEKHEGEDMDDDGEEDEGDEEDEMEHGDHNNDHVAPTNAVKDFISQLFEGTIIHSERHEFNGKIYWEVYVENASGAIIKVKLIEEPLELLKIEGEVGPFDFVLTPYNDILPLSQILEIVFQEADGELVEWELKSEIEDGETIWIYEFELHGETLRFEIKINAVTGEFIEFKEND